MNELFNKKHGITESAVKECRDLNLLHCWKLNVKKDVVEIEGKLASITAKNEDHDSIKRMSHALNMQVLLLEVIENRIRELDGSNDIEYNQMFVTVSRDLMSLTLYDEVVREVENRMLNH